MFWGVPYSAYYIIKDKDSLTGLFIYLTNTYLVPTVYQTDSLKALDVLSYFTCEI